MKEVVNIPNNILLAEVSRLLDEGHDVCLMTKGNSMLPFIIGGRDSVILRKSSTVAAGDIVLAHLNGENYVLHRVVSVASGNVTLMGDGNIRGREHCATEDVCGTVISIIDNQGKKKDCRNRSHMRKAKIWIALLPVRRYLLAIMRRTVFKNKTTR